MIKSIKPKKFLDVKALNRAIDRALDRTAKEALVEIKKPTRTWNHKVDFYITAKRKRSNDVILAVGTQDKIFGYVSRGTRPHKIRAKRAKSLRFATGGTPKTTPGSLLPGRGSEGSTVNFSPEVNHPGNEGRHFEEQVAKKMTPKLKRYMNQEIKKELPK